MASIKKINGYDIKDETARNGLLTKQDIFQVDTLPAADSSNVGKIYQYKGNTAPLVNGYFYQCQAQGTNPETYAFVNINVQPAGGKTVDENGNLYITDDFALDGDDQQYPLIYRTKSEDDSNVIKINAPVEIEENPDTGSSRPLRVSGSLEAKDTKVESLTIDGTVRANGNIWMGRTSLVGGPNEYVINVIDQGDFYYYSMEGDAYKWVRESDQTYAYTAEEFPSGGETVYGDASLTAFYSTVYYGFWTGGGIKEEWHPERASIKEVNEITFHKDGVGNRGIRNVNKITGLKYGFENHHEYQWSIDATGNAYFNKISCTQQRDGKPMWRVSSDGTYYGGRLSFEQSDGTYLGSNKMGGLEVHGGLWTEGEFTVHGTSHIYRDIKLYPYLDSTQVERYARIYPDVNETCTLGTPNHRFEKIYVKDLDVSGEGGIDISHLDGVEEINENTLQFEKISTAASGYYNEDGQYVGSTVTQYLNDTSELPMTIVSFVGSDGYTYEFGATADGVTAWYDTNYGVYRYTANEEVQAGDGVYTDKELGNRMTYVATVNKEAPYDAINGDWKYNSSEEVVSEIGVTYPECQGIRIRHPNLLVDDLVYRYYSQGVGNYSNYFLFHAENARASDWSDGIARPWVWLYRCMSPSQGQHVDYVSSTNTSPYDDSITNADVLGTERQYIECIKGLTTEGGSNPGDLELVRTVCGGQTSSIYHGQYWDGSQLVDTYVWLDNSYNPRFGDTMYKAAYDASTNAATKLNDVLGTVTFTYRPQNSVTVEAETGSAPAIHNFTQKHFNYYKARLITVANADSVAGFEYGGRFEGDQNRQLVVIGLNSNAPGGVVDLANSTMQLGQSVEVYDGEKFLSTIDYYSTASPYISYVVLTKNTVSSDNPRSLFMTGYGSGGQEWFRTTVIIGEDGKCNQSGILFKGVTTVDANVSIKIDVQRTGDTVQYTLDSSAQSPVYNNTRLLEKSDLTWAFCENDISTDNICWKLAGGRSNQIYNNSNPIDGYWINSKDIRNPSVGSVLYMYCPGSASKVVTLTGNRPIVQKTTTVKEYSWVQKSGMNRVWYTFARNPQLNSHYWGKYSWGGIYWDASIYPVTSVVPMSPTGIYYIRSTSQYVYYDGSEFEECFKREASDDVIYSDIKLNSFYYWRAKDGSYIYTEGDHYEEVSSYDDLPVPNAITISVAPFNTQILVRNPSYDTGVAISWSPFNDDSVHLWTNKNNFVCRVGDKVYTDGGLMTEVGTITNISYEDEHVKVNNTEYDLVLNTENADSYFTWVDSNSYGNFVYSKMPNPEVGDVFYYDSEFATEAGSVTEIVSGEPKAGTFYVLDNYDPLTSTGHYFWNGADFVEAERTYKTITLYGDDNDLGKPRKPWNNVYAKSVESPYGTITTKNGYVEVNGGKVTNVTEIKYNGSNYIYTSTGTRTTYTISVAGISDLVPVELTIGYCKWQSESLQGFVRYTRDLNVDVNDWVYSDKECSTKVNQITAVTTDTEPVYTWTNAGTGTSVYSIIRQLVAEDEIYDNITCIRSTNAMYVTSTQYTEIYKESIIMNNDSITLVIRDGSGNVAGSCTLTAAKLNTLDSLLN